MRKKIVTGMSLGIAAFLAFSSSPAMARQLWCYAVEDVSAPTGRHYWATSPVEVSDDQIGAYTNRFLNELAQKGLKHQGYSCDSSETYNKFIADMPRFNHRLDMVSVPLTVGSKDGTSLRNPVNRHAPCQPVRSLARNNELSCTKAGEQEFSYCVAKTLNSNRLDYYYSTIFVTTWPGSVNGNTLHDANNETRFGNNVTREYGVTVDADCRYEVTQNGAFAARDAKKDSINRQGAASRVPVNNTQTTLAP